MSRSTARPGPWDLTVGAAIARRGRLLLVRRAETVEFLPGLWDLPGGHVAPGETLGAALRREIREELGCEARLGAPFFAHADTMPRDGHANVPTAEVDFLAEIPPRARLRLDPREHIGAAWVRPADLARHPTSPRLAAIVRAAFREIRRSPGRPPRRLPPRRRRSRSEPPAPGKRSNPRPA